MRALARNKQVVDEPVVVIMAKQPIAGQAKTRLCPPLTASEAAGLYEAMLRDTVGWVGDLEGVQVAIAITPPEAVAAWRDLGPPDAILLPVAGVDIGDCLQQVLSWLLSSGHAKVLALNSDGPTLPARYVLQAIATLDHADVVLGPSEDGGYYLIGLKEEQPELFQGIAWSTRQVTAQTQSRAREAGLSVALLPTWYDVDTPDDLERLRSEVAALPDATMQHTRRYLAQLSAGVGRNKVLRRVETARAEVERLLQGALESAWLETAEGTWTVKDVVGHLAAWSELLLDGVEAVVRGEAEAIQPVDVDAWNAEQIAARQAQPVQQVRAAWMATTERAAVTAAQLSVDQWACRQAVPWADRPMSPSDLYDLWLDHIEQHHAALVAWSERQTGTPSRVLGGERKKRE